MEKKMSGRVVVVAGASEGIGRAVVERLTADGAHVVAYARRPTLLKEMAQAVRTAGGSIEAKTLDVSDIPAYRAAIRDVHARHGRIDGLVNNAFSNSAGAVMDLADDNWRRDFLVNCDAVFASTQEALRVMQPVRRGSIVNIASTAGTHGLLNMASYSASKAALIMFSNVAAAEAAPHNVRINVVSPGWIVTTGSQIVPGSPQASIVEGVIPMNRGGDPSELANTVCFLLSDEASYVTGACIPVGGGLGSILSLPISQSTLSAVANAQ